MKKIIVLSICCLFLVNLLSCASLNTSKIPVGGIAQPFAVHQLGASVETDLRIKEYRPYLFELQLWFKNMSDTDYIEQFAWNGGGTTIYLSVEVTGLDENNKSFSYYKKLYAGGRTAHGSAGKWKPPGMAGYHNRRIDTLLLKPGLYHIKVVSLDNVPELASIPVSFSICSPYKIQKLKQD